MSKERPPIVVVVGHIDHGKSKLLDYIRESNVVAGEAGGITQHINAYEAGVVLPDGKKKQITFIDTPGHQSFSEMRTRGCSIADIAILIVSAEEGVKAQTLEALNSIKECQMPYVVAINKIDKPEANIEKTKNSLLEKEVYLEGLGGDVPYVAISAETGEGVPELLETIILMAELEELKGDSGVLAEGFVIEGNLDPRRGISASLIIKNGSLKSGNYVVSGVAGAPVKIMENFLGQPTKEAGPSDPINIVGWNKLPKVGSEFRAYVNKKEALASTNGNESKEAEIKKVDEAPDKLQQEEIVSIIPITLKADTEGSVEAIKSEIKKIEEERVLIKIVEASTGNITENDIKTASGSKDSIVLGFNIKSDRGVEVLAERLGVETKTFNIIYKLTEWLQELAKARKPKIKTEEVGGKARILKIFSKIKDKQVIGAEVFEGNIDKDSKIRILRRGEDIGAGNILELQVLRNPVESVSEGNQFGAKISSQVEIAEKDNIEAFSVVEK